MYRVLFRPNLFNVFNFSRKELQVIETRNMSDDMLAASVSLPMWFEPVHIVCC